MKKFMRASIASVGFLIIVVFFQNCKNAGVTNAGGTSSSTSPSSLAWSTTFKTVVSLPGLVTGMTDNTLIGAGDLIGDNRPELLFQNKLGDLSYWNLKSSGQYDSAVSYGPPPTPKDKFRFVGVYDLFGNGQKEILWQQTEDITPAGGSKIYKGEVYFWRLNSNGTLNQVVQIVYNNASLSTWRLVCAADLNGDGKAELIWQSTTGELAYWTLNPSGQYQGVTSIAYSTPGSLNGWNLIGAADLDGDNKPEFLWQNSTNDSVYYWKLNNGQYAGVKDFGHQSTAGWRLAGAGDINNDGHPELIWQSRTDWSVVYWQLQ